MAPKRLCLEDLLTALMCKTYLIFLYQNPSKLKQLMCLPPATFSPVVRKSIYTVHKEIGHSRKVPSVSKVVFKSDIKILGTRKDKKCI